MASMKDKIQASINNTTNPETKIFQGLFKTDVAIKHYMPKEGNLRLLILPTIMTGDYHPLAIADNINKGDTFYRRVFYVHKNIGPSRKKVICPSTFGDDCPICEEFFRLRKDPNADKSLLNSCRRSMYEAYNVIDLTSQATMALGVQLFAISYGKFGKEFLEEIKLTSVENLNFTETGKEGRIVTARVVKDTFDGSEFLRAKKFNFEPKPENLCFPFENIQSELYDIDALFDRKSIKEIKHILNTVSFEDDSEEMTETIGDVLDEGTVEYKVKEEVPSDLRSVASPTTNILGIFASPASVQKKEVVPVSGIGSLFAGANVPVKEQEKAQETVKTETTSVQSVCPEGGQFGVNTGCYSGCGTCNKFDECDSANVARIQALRKARSL